MGDAAPFLILVAVRAIAPVAGMPPKRGVTILAIPCPMSSRLLLCLLPDMPSATTADNKDSIPPSMAITNAGGSNSFIFSKENCGRVSVGSMLGIAPKVVPIVAIFPLKNKVAAILETSSATKEAGILGKILGNAIRMARLIIAVITLYMLNVARC